MIGLAAVALSIGFAGQWPSPSKVWWVFLERTKAPLNVSKEQGDKMQEGHIGNFKRLFGLHKLVSAGPLKDVPGGTKRGIVVLTVGDLKAVKHCFLPDPYVQAGVFDLHAIPMDVQFGRFQTDDISPDGIEENRLVVFTSAHTLSHEASMTHWEYVCGTGPSRHMKFAASSAGKDDIRGVMVVQGTDDAGLQAWLDGDVVVKSGVLKATIYPQWLAKGSL